MEVTFEQFMQSKTNGAPYHNFNYHKCVIGSVWKKICNPVKMSRQRLIKLLMATGKYERDSAEKKVQAINLSGESYIDFYRNNAPMILWDIQHRISPTERVVVNLWDGEAPLYCRKKARAFDESVLMTKIKKKELAQNKKEYKEFLSIMEKHPECVDLESSRKALMNFKIEGLGGKEIVTGFREFNKLIDFYTYL